MGLFERFSRRETNQPWRGLNGRRGSELMPQARLSGPTPWVIAIMVAVTVIAAAAGLSFSNTARNAADELSGGITVQIVEAHADTRLRQAEAAAQRLRATPGVLDAHVVSPAEIDRLIEPWLGARADGDDAVPVPALVDARLRTPVDAETLGALRRSVREVAPAARVDAQSTWLNPVFAAINSVQWLALAMVGMLAFALTAAVVLAVRNSLGTNRDTIEIVHLLGGSDAQIAGLVQRAIGIEAASGAAVGFGIGALAVLLLGNHLAQLGAGLVDSGGLVWIDWLLIALVPLGGVVLAIFAARWTVLRNLRRML